jgi:hypothetical protein
MFRIILNFLLAFQSVFFKQRIWVFLEVGSIKCLPNHIQYQLRHLLLECCEMAMS